MLNFNWKTPTILEVQEVSMSWTSDTKTYWYYDTANLLQNTRGVKDEVPTHAMREDQIAWMREHHIPNAAKQIAKREADALQRARELADRAHIFANPAATVLWLDDDMDEWAGHPFTKLPKPSPVSIILSGIDRIFTEHDIKADGTMFTNEASLVARPNSGRVLGERTGIIRLGIRGRDHAIAKGYITAGAELATTLMIQPVAHTDQPA